MKSLVAYFKKEWLESVRSGKFFILLLLFIFLGILNPLITKLTPWLLSLMSDSLPNSGITIGNIAVDANASWAQFFKNIPIALLVFVVMYSSIFTKEYQRGTLRLILTKGLARSKVLLSKFLLLFLYWTFCFWLCFLVTYIYNDFYWSNEITQHLFLSAGLWWGFGIWILSVILVCSIIFNNNSSVLLGSIIPVILSYILSLLPPLHAYLPTTLIDSASLLANISSGSDYSKTTLVTFIFIIINLAISIPYFNKKEL